MTDLMEGQIWRKRGPYGWLKIIQILDPEYSGHDGGKHGARCNYYPPQLNGIQCRGGTIYFVADEKLSGGIIRSWEEQLAHNRYLLTGFKRGESV